MSEANGDSNQTLKDLEKRFADAAKAYRQNGSDEEKAKLERCLTEVEQRNAELTSGQTQLRLARVVFEHLKPEVEENRRALMQEASDWAQHYSTVRATVGTFLITLSIGILTFGWERNDPLLVRAAAGVWFVALVLFLGFTIAEYGKLGHLGEHREVLRKSITSTPATSHSLKRLFKSLVNPKRWDYGLVGFIILTVLFGLGTLNVLSTNPLGTHNAHVRTDRIEVVNSEGTVVFEAFADDQGAGRCILSDGNSDRKIVIQFQVLPSGEGGFPLVNLLNDDGRSAAMLAVTQYELGHMRLDGSTEPAARSAIDLSTTPQGGLIVVNDERGRSAATINGLGGEGRVTTYRGSATTGQIPERMEAESSQE